MDEILAEVVRQNAIADESVTIDLSDTELMMILAKARERVLHDSALRTDQEIRFPFSDPDAGSSTVLLPKNLALILAECYHGVRNKIEERWAQEHADKQPLFHERELPSAANVVDLLPTDREVTRSDSQLVQDYLKVAGQLEHEGLVGDIVHAHEPKPDVLQGRMHIDVPALEAAQTILDGVLQRLVRIFRTPPVHIARSMKEWRAWEGQIRTASPADIADIHALYGGVLLSTEQLVRLDPRFADRTQFNSVVDHVRSHGAMFKALKTQNGDDEVTEGLRAGRIAIVRDEPQADAPERPGTLLGFYNVIGNPDEVTRHMKTDLHFASQLSYDTTGDLPNFSKFVEQSGEMRSINYRDERGALRVFKAAKEGRLAWSVDHAVRMDGPHQIQRYAQLGTALKLDEYDHFVGEGKTMVLLKIATLIGADASDAARAHHIPWNDAAVTSGWMREGRCQWEVDNSGMVVLPDPIANVGSAVLNQRLGAHEVWTVEEEFERDGVRMRVLWSYYAQQLPPQIP